MTAKPTLRVLPGGHAEADDSAGRPANKSLLGCARWMRDLLEQMTPETGMDRLLHNVLPDLRDAIAKAEERAAKRRAASGKHPAA